MKPIDDQLLEFMEEEGNMTPGAIEAYGGITGSDYAGERLKVLCNYGLVERLHRGLYRLTDEGRAYLDEELDASELEAIDEGE
jgi:hypothetical protein